MNIQEAVKFSENHDIVVMGGTEPGHTTDTVAIQLAKELGAECCIIATNVGHVYSSDPRTNEDAKKFETMSHQELSEIVGARVINLLGLRVLIDASKNCPRRSSGEIFFCPREQ